MTKIPGKNIKIPGKNIIKNPSKTTTKITGKKNGSKTLVKENDGGSCGVDSLDLLGISLEFADLYEQSQRKAFRYLQKEAKEIGANLRELQQSLLKGVKKDETDIKGCRQTGCFGYLSGTVGDDELIMNESDDLGGHMNGGPSQNNVYGLLGDDIITNNVRYFNRGDWLLDRDRDKPNVIGFYVNAYGGPGKDHFSAHWRSRNNIYDLEEGEKVTLTHMTQNQLEQVSFGNRSTVRGEILTLGLNAGSSFSIYSPGDLTFEPLEPVIHACGTTGCFAQSFKAVVSNIED